MKTHSNVTTSAHLQILPPRTAPLPRILSSAPLPVVFNASCWFGENSLSLRAGMPSRLATSKMPRSLGGTQ